MVDEEKSLPETDGGTSLRPAHGTGAQARGGAACGREWDEAGEQEARRKKEPQKMLKKAEAKLQRV